MPKKNIGELAFLGVIVLYVLIYFFTDITPLHKNTQIKSYVLFIMAVLLALIAVQLIIMMKDTDFVRSIRFQPSDLMALIKDPLTFLIIATVVYLALIPIVGFFVISFVYIAAVIWFLNIRRKLILFMAPLAYNVIMFFCFDYLLDLRFPRGFLF